MTTPTISRGDVWWVTLDPTQGAEIQKTRPCVVLTHNALNQLRRTVIVVPLSTAASAHPPITGRSGAKASLWLPWWTRCERLQNTGSEPGWKPSHQMTSTAFARPPLKFCRSRSGAGGLSPAEYIVYGAHRTNSSPSSPPFRSLAFAA